jgi:hypothetical protein
MLHKVVLFTYPLYATLVCPTKGSFCEGVSLEVLMPPLAEEEHPLEVVPGRGGPEAVSNISTQGQPLPFSMQFILHCNENPIYVFLFWELQGLSPNFDIYVSVNDLYIPRIGPHISCSKIGRSIVGIYKSLTDT